MTAKERVLASRLIQKIDNNNSYARQIGLSYTVLTAGEKKCSSKPEVHGDLGKEAGKRK